MILAFEHVSGLSVNLNKLELLFSEVPEKQKQSLVNVLGCQIGTFPFLYLGLPLSNQKLPKIAYVPLIEKMNKRLGCWVAKHLTIAGRLVLLNAVLFSLPTYFMTVFKLPKWVIKNMNKIRRRFLCHGVTQEKKRMNLVAWDLVCKPKEDGGLGVKDLEISNQALLLKWHWYWTKSEDRIRKQIYRLTVSTDTSAIGVSLREMTLRHFFNASVVFTPGNRGNIFFWEQDWGEGILKHKFSILYTYAIITDITLLQAMSDQDQYTYLRQNLSTEAQRELTRMLQKMLNYTLNVMVQDELRWRWDSKGEFTVRSAYRTLIGGPTIGS